MMKIEDIATPVETVPMTPLEDAVKVEETPKEPVKTVVENKSNVIESKTYTPEQGVQTFVFSTKDSIPLMLGDVVRVQANESFVIVEVKSKQRG